MRTARRVQWLAVAAGLALAVTHCNRSTPSPENTAPVTSPQTPPAPTPTPTPTPPAPTPGNAAPSGPRAEINGPQYALTVKLANNNFELELHGAGGYHVNEQYPIAVDLEVQNGSVAKPALRRADAAALSQEVARFTQPVQSTGAGTVVRGRCRFGVCRAEQCMFETREFAVSM